MGVLTHLTGTKEEIRGIKGLVKGIFYILVYLLLLKGLYDLHLLKLFIGKGSFSGVHGFWIWCSWLPSLADAEVFLAI